MYEESLLKKMVALSCAVSIAATAHPYSIAGSSTAAPVTIGILSATGSAEVRGVRTRETTLFSGDRIRALDNSYVKVVLKDGHRLELSANTDVKLSQNSEATRVVVLSGLLGFTSSEAGPLRLNVQTLEVVAGPDHSGQVNAISANLVSIGAVKGRLTVHNSETGESFVVSPGTRTVFGLRGEKPVSQQPPQEPQQPQQPATIKVPPPSAAGGGKALSTKILIIGGIAGAGAAIAAVAATRGDNTASPSMPR